MTEQKTIYLAALLHDIGKFIERGKNFTKEGKLIKEENELQSYPHRFFSDLFVKEKCNFITNSNDVSDGVLYHHKPKKDKKSKQKVDSEIIPRLIYISDHLSSSERRNLYGFIKWGYYSKGRLLSIFSRLKRDSETVNDWDYLQTEILDIHNLIQNCNKDAYSKENDYFDNVEKLFNDTVKENNLHDLIYKYTCYVPSQTRSYFAPKAVPDISLFDHLRTTAAIALCLQVQKEKTKVIDENELFTYKLNYDKEEKKYKVSPEPLISKHLFTLLQCDFSGIQPFIFDVESKGAAKALKGRSAYIQVLSDVIAKYLIDCLELEEANIIYNGGGNFYILMPQCLEEKAKKELKYISNVMYKAHKGDLYLAHGFTPVNMKDFGNFAQKWYNSRRVVVQNKINRWKELGKDRKEIFIPFDADKNKYETDFYKSFADLTRQIKNANYISFENTGTKELDFSNKDLLNSYQSVFEAFGYHVRFEENMPQIAENLSIYKLNDTDFDDCTGFKFMVNKLPEESDFSKIAEFAEGDKKLGLLKMDMDNLGEIFKEGLSSDDRSISRVATLSRNIHLFFEGYLNTILDDEGFVVNSKRIIYPIYAGGDDLLFIGPYDKMIDLAQRIHDDFKKFVAQNPEINISGALVIIYDKFPLKEAARQVDEHLKKAKSNKDKNSISIMGEVLSWEEFDKMLELREFLLKVVNANENKDINVLKKVNASTRGLNKIIRNTSDNTLFIESVSKLMYYIRDIKTGKQSLANLYKDIILNDFFGKIDGLTYFRDNKEPPSNINLMIIPIACKIAEMLTRKL